MKETPSGLEDLRMIQAHGTRETVLIAGHRERTFLMRLLSDAEEHQSMALSDIEGRSECAQWADCSACSHCSGQSRANYAAGWQRRERARIRAVQSVLRRMETTRVRSAGSETDPKEWRP